MGYIPPYGPSVPDWMRTVSAASRGFHTYSQGVIGPGSNNSVASDTEAASGDAIYFGRGFSGTKAVGASPSTNLAYGPVGYMFDLRFDDADCGADFSRALYGRTVFGGSDARGGRIGVLGEAYQQFGATNSANVNRNYVGTVGQGVSDTGDGGTNLTTDARGAFFGLNGLGMLRTGATNVYEVTGVELNTYMQTGTSSRFVFGATIAGFNSVRGSAADAALEIGGGDAGGGFTHVGWKHGILFTDIHDGDPFASDSTILGAYWETGSARTITHGIDLSGFAFSGKAWQSPGMSIDGSGYIIATVRGNFANDAAAAAGGVPVGELYRNGSVVQIRVS